MKNIIKNILLEEAGGGTYDDPLYDDSPNMVPPTSYDARKYNHKTKTYEVVSVPKPIFLKAVTLLARRFSKSWFDDMSKMDDDIWHRQEEMLPTLKILGIGDRDGGISNKTFWAANDNFDGLRDGSITQYDQLELRALSLYSVPISENVQVYKTLYWAPEVIAYDEDDAYATVLYDDDGAYDSWEWDGHSSYKEDDHNWEGEGKELEENVFEIRTLYPYQSGEGGASTPEQQEEDPEVVDLSEAVGPSPEENDILDELEMLVTSLGDTDCSSQLKELIKKYKNLPLNERYNKKNIRRN